MIFINCIFVQLEIIRICIFNVRQVSEFNDTVQDFVQGMFVVLLAGINCNYVFRFFNENSNKARFESC